MIVVCDLLCKSMSHEKVNSGFIYGLSLAFPGEAIRFYADATHIEAIKKMSITDGLKILKGDSSAATNYLKENTSQQLTEKIRPVIEASLKKVNATKYWSDVFSNYNKFLHQNVNTDLAAYVGGKTSDAIFYTITQEEHKIRKDPSAQVTDLLRKVFGKKE